MIAPFVFVIGLIFGVTSEKCQSRIMPNVTWQIYMKVSFVKLYSCEIVALDETDCHASSNDNTCENNESNNKYAQRCRSVLKNDPNPTYPSPVQGGELLCYDCQSTGEKYSRMSLRSSEVAADMFSNEIYISQNIEKYSSGKFVQDNKAHIWDITQAPPPNLCDLALVDTSDFTKFAIGVKEIDVQTENYQKKYLVLINKTTSETTYVLELLKSDNSCGFATWTTTNPSIIITEVMINEKKISKPISSILNRTDPHQFRSCTAQSQPTERNELQELKGRLEVVCYAVAAILCCLTLHLVISAYNAWKTLSIFGGCVFLQGNANRMLLEQMRNAGATQKGHKPNVEQYEYITSEYAINDLYRTNRK